MQKWLILDPGHNGPDPGAVGVHGLREADVVLAIAERTRELLAADLVVTFMTHRGGGASLVDRCAFANEALADIFISLHCNAHTTPDARGFEVWTSPGQTRADVIATSIFEELTAAFPLMPGRADHSDNDPDKEARFYVLTHTRMPAVLVEFGFVTNPADAAILAYPDGQLRCAQALAAAIRRHI